MFEDNGALFGNGSYEPADEDGIGNGIELTLPADTAVRTKRVLVIEDDRELVDLLALHLDTEGYQVTAAVERIDAVMPHLLEVPLGGTAVGTGIKVHRWRT